MAYSDTAKGWGLTPGAAAQNLGRMAGGGYGNMYGVGEGKSGIYEQRMAQIRGNFAARQAQLTEDRRRTENDRAYSLNRQKLEAAKDQWADQFDYGKEQDLAAQGNWQQQFDYGKERDLLAKDQWDKQFDYGKERDLATQENWQKQFDHTKGQDSIAQGNWQNQFDYGKTQDNTSQENWQKQFDITQAEADRAKERWEREQTAQAERQRQEALAKQNNLTPNGTYRNSSGTNSNYSNGGGLTGDAYKAKIYNDTRQAIAEVASTGNYTSAPYDSSSFERSPAYRQAIAGYNERVRETTAAKKAREDASIKAENKRRKNEAISDKWQTRGEQLREEEWQNRNRATGGAY